ncbi:MAG: glycosyltransferase family 4 protein [Protaetiibacter sp.]
MTSAEAYRAAFDDRMRSAADALGLSTEGRSVDVAEAVLGAATDDARSWLAYVAFTGAFPTADALASFRRELLLAPPGRRVSAILPLLERRGGLAATALRRLMIVADRPVVDVGHSATSDHNTGIQRVVRRTLPHWDPDAMLPVAWTADSTAFRMLDEAERIRLLEWGRHAPAEARARDVDTIVVPWATTVVLPEVPTPERIEPLAALARSSGSRTVIVGHDAIPIVSADLLDASESNRFALFLSVVKRADLVCAVSESAAREFSGFVDALQAQGLAGPIVRAIPLGEQEVAAVDHVDDDSALPLVVCVGSHEPRKNQETVLAAAVLLQQQGVRFRMVFVGGGSRSHTADFDRRVRRLRAHGLQIEARRGASDEELAALSRRARFSVLVSLHEGFGLPVVESLAAGVPVLTSDYGSMAEIARGGGCVLVDPRDVTAVRDGMARLLGDDELIARLRSEAAARPRRSWGDYATELWSAVREVAPR